MPPTDNTRTDNTRTAGTPATIAGGVGAMAACCTVHLLIVAGVLAGLGAAAIGGIALGVGLAAATTVWGIAVLLRHRRSASPGCCPDPAEQQRVEHLPAAAKGSPR